MVLVAGLPVAAVAFFWAAGTVHGPQPDHYEQRPPSELGLRLFAVSLELVLAWFVALVFVLLRWRPGASRGRRPRG